MNGLFAILVFAAPVVTPLPRLVLVRETGVACGTPALEEAGGRTRALGGGPPGFCVRDAFLARLDDGASTHAVLRVSGSVADAAERVFIYRLDGDELVPRYLASGPSHLRLVDVEPVNGVERDALRIRTVDASGNATTLLCGFVGFPLLCAPSLARAMGQLSGIVYETVMFR
jgi:hypothetical protein